ncbi:MAG: SPOR domain-containing protein, partial [Draconibacterium sp.]
DNLMINYYYGACRTENGHYGTNEINYLLKGSTGESPLKTDYYLGIQYQAMQQWDNALTYYLKYQKTAAQEEQTALGLPEKIQQCRDQFSPFEVETEDIAPVPIAKEESPQAETDTIAYAAVTDSISSDSFLAEEMKIETPVAIPGKKQKPAPINFDVNSEMMYVETSNFQTEEGLESYLKWKQLSHQLDSLTRNLDEWRRKYAEANTSSLKNALGQKIVDAEGSLFTLQRDTRESLQNAQRAETDYWNSQPELEKIDFIASLKEHAASLNQPQVEISEALDTALIIATEILPVVVPANQQPAAEQQDELVYKVQIGAYSRGLPSYVKRQFDKLSLIRKIDQYTDEKGVVVYTTGNLTNYEDAQKMQTQVRREGVEDAFVVPYFNGKRITLSEAKKLEAEQ